MATRANETVVRVTADATGYTSELDRARRSASTFAEANELASRRVEIAQAAVREAVANGSSATTKQVNDFVRQLTRQAQTAGLTADAQRSLRAANIGVKNSVEPLLSHINAANDAIARQATEARAAATQANAYRDGLDRITGGAVSTIEQVSILTAGLGPLGTGLAGLALGVPAVAALEVGFYRTAIAAAQVQAEVDKLRVGLKFINGGDTAAAADDMDFLRATAERLGLDLTTTAGSYIKLAAASRETSLEGQRTKDIFTAVSEAATVLHLTSAETEGALNAIQQMMSKGAVQAEELRGQLGERLPGAFQIAARAMGVTTQELGKMLEQGQVISTDFLPKFAAQMRQEFAGAVEEASESAQASLGRAGTAWTDLKRTISDSGLGDFAVGQINILTDGVNSVTQAMRRAKDEGAGFWGQMLHGAGAVAQFLNPVNAVGYSAQSLEGERKRLQDERKLYEGRVDTDRGAKNRVGQIDRRLAAMEPKTSPDDVLAASEREAAQFALSQQRDQKAISDRIAAFVSGGKSKTDKEQYDAALKQVQAEFDAATAGAEKGTAQYEEALKAATERKKELTEKYNKAGLSKSAGVEKSIVSARIQELEQASKTEEALLKDNVDRVKSLRSLGILSEAEALDREHDLREESLSKQMDIIQRQEAEAEKGGVKELAALKKYQGEEQRIALEMLANDKKTAEAHADLATKQASSLKLFQDSLDSAYRTRTNAIQDSLASVGLGDKQIDEMRRVNDVLRDLDRQQSDLLKQKDAGRIDQSEYDARLAALAADGQKRIALERSFNDQMAGVQGDWVKGFEAAGKNYIDVAGNVAGQTKSAFAGLYDGLTDGLAKLATGSQVSFGSIAQSFAQTLIKMQIQAAASSLFNGGSGGAGILGLLGKVAGLFSGTPTAPVADVAPITSGIDGSSWISSAKGNVFDTGRLVPFAKGGAFTNTIQTSRKTFPLADGRMGEMAEAGPEAIMPLKRAADGSLGVRGVIAAAQAAQAPAMPRITINNNGTPQVYQTESISRDEIRLIAEDAADRRSPAAVAGAMSNGYRPLKTALAGQYKLEPNR